MATTHDIRGATPNRPGLLARAAEAKTNEASRSPEPGNHELNATELAVFSSLRYTAFEVTIIEENYIPI